MKGREPDSGGGRRLLIVGINYEPEETGIAPYTTGLAEHMASRGWHVTVVTGLPSYPQWRVFDEYRGTVRRRERSGEVDVHRLWHHVPSQQSAARRAMYEATFFAHALVHRTPGRPDCVVAVIPSLGGGVAAALHAKRWRVPLGLVVQDLMGQAAAQSGIPGGGLVARPAEALERWVVGRADGVAIVSETFRTHLEAAGVDPARVVHLPNWTHVSAPSGRAKEVRETMGWPRDQQIVVHAGNMGYKQGLHSVVEAARLAVEHHRDIRFVLMGDGNARRDLEALATGLPNVQFLDPQPRAIFMDVLAAADVLLLNERPSVVNMSLPSKITSYFRAGRPVVAAVSGGGATAMELERSGGALVVPAAEPQSLLEALRSLSHDGALVQRLVGNALAYADKTLDKERSLERAEAFLTGLCPWARPVVAPPGER